jgi:hypothetical protein
MPLLLAPSDSWMVGLVGWRVRSTNLRMVFDYCGVRIWIGLVYVLDGLHSSSSPRRPGNAWLAQP